jgi:integrase
VHRAVEVAAVEADDILAMALAAKKRSRSTVHATVSVCSGLFRWAVKQRLADTNPVARARELYGAEMMPMASERVPRTLSDDEVARAMEHVSARFTAALTILAETGIRTSECLGLTWPRADLENETIEIAGQLANDSTVRATKTRRTRVVPISAWSRRATTSRPDSCS